MDGLSRGIIAAICALPVMLICGGWSRTIHRSFTTRGVGVGGGATTLVPVDSRVAKALDEAHAKEVAREMLLIGKVTRVVDGNTIWVTPNYGVRSVVRLDRIVAPSLGHPYGQEAAEYLRRLIGERTVTVKWCRKDDFGRILGVVWVKPKGEKAEVEVNLGMVKDGMARHNLRPEEESVYREAQDEARDARRGLWAQDKVVK